MESLLNRKAEIFKALSHPVRLAIAEKLADRPRCVHEIAGWFGCTRTNVSKHLGILRQSGIVKDRKEGLKVYYSLDLECLEPFLKCLDGTLREETRNRYERWCCQNGASGRGAESSGKRKWTIQVLGTDCPDCFELENRAEKAALSAGLEFEIIKLSEMEDLLALGTAITPSLALEGEILFEGQVPSVDEIAAVFKKRASGFPGTEKAKEKQEKAGDLMEGKMKILFLCTGNSCRSQMAEGWARALKADSIEAWSAGTDPGEVNPMAVRVMKEAGVDISGQKSKHVESLMHVPFDVVITLCGDARDTCPVFPGDAKVVHRGFDDPARAEGSEEEILSFFRRVRDEIRDFVETLPASVVDE
jgi:thioredoxin type arsenate reductase